MHDEAPGGPGLSMHK